MGETYLFILYYFLFRKHKKMGKITHEKARLYFTLGERQRLQGPHLITRGTRSGSGNRSRVRSIRHNLNRKKRKKEEDGGETSEEV